MSVSFVWQKFFWSVDVRLSIVIECPTCRGKGSEVSQEVTTAIGGTWFVSMPCPVCAGSGRVIPLAQKVGSRMYEGWFRNEDWQSFIHATP